MILRSMSRFSWVTLISFMLGMGVLVGCDDDGDNGGNGGGTDPVTVTITLGNNSLEVNLRDLQSFEIEGLEADSLNNLIPDDFIDPWVDPDTVEWDMRPLHGYRPVGSDGFNPHDDRGYDDLYWEWMSLGFIFVETRNVIFPDSLIDLPGAFNVNDTNEFLIFRKLNVIVPFDSFLVEFDDITPTPVLNPDSVMENALPLSDFLPDTIVTLGPENYAYKVRGMDGFPSNRPLTWEQLQAGYWLLDTEKTWFLADSLQTGHYKVQALARIEVF